MLQFLIHDPKGPSRERPLMRAHLLGRDDQPVAGTVELIDGRLVCRPEEGTATALCLEFDAEPVGCLMLQTCLLPQRDEPYLLNLELARHRISRYIAKGEEWLLFDPASGGDSFKIWERARTLFVQAMNEPNALVAEGKARESLVAAIEASERLAMMQAEGALQRRYGQRKASSTVIGVRVDPRLDPAKTGGAAKEFDVVAVETRWSEIEPEPGKFRFDAVDRWMALAAQHKRPIVAGPLLCFDPGWVPSWMEKLKGDYKAIVDRSYIFMEQVVHRYRAVATLWNLCSGLHTNAWYAFSDSERIDLTRRAALLARQSRRGARTLVELGDPFGETISDRKRSITAWTFLERLMQEGIHLDAVGMQMRMGDRAAGFGVRDMLQVSAALDRFMGFECKVMLSAVGVPSEPVKGAGWWRRAWSPAMQEAWASSLVTVALSKPFVETLVWERLGDTPDTERGACGLLDAANVPKPAAKKLLAIRNRLQKPLLAPKADAPKRSEVEANDETAAGSPPA
jgi:GH35 family endo-1,4-beta-xylanase